MEHTPTPWHLGYGYIWGPQMEMIGDMEAEEAYVLRMRGVGGNLPIDANAVFIVEAVNNYDALRARCNELEAALKPLAAPRFDVGDSGAIHYFVTKQEVQKARAVLSQQTDKIRAWEE